MKTLQPSDLEPVRDQFKAQVMAQVWDQVSNQVWAQVYDNVAPI